MRMQSAMSQRDRMQRALFVALAVGLAWGIRGDFGHSIGAMYPGAVLGLAFAYVSGQAAMMRWAPILGAVGGLGISLGGAMSYGILHGYAQSDTFINYAYGYFTLILEGGAWGALGCAALGLVLETERPGWLELLLMTVAMIAGGAVFQALVVSGMGFHINPPRNDLSIGFTGAVIVLFAWLAARGHRSGLKGAMAGYIGFGVGMAMARMISNGIRHWDIVPNHWNIMEVGTGFFGGLVFAYTMLGKEAPGEPEGKGFSILSAAGAIYVMFLIPLLHRLAQFGPDKIKGWTTELAGYGYSNPGKVIHFTLGSLSALCVVGLLLSIVWIVLWQREVELWPSVPALAFSLIMLLVQNLGALFLFYPHRNGVNMHIVFWVMFGLMALHAVFVRHDDITDTDDVANESHWPWWLLGSAGAFVFILFMAQFVNDKLTMTNANTRFPVWSWNQGPFPGLHSEKGTSPGANP